MRELATDMGADFKRPFENHRPFGNPYKPVPKEIDEVMRRQKFNERNNNAKVSGTKAESRVSQ